MRHRQLAQHDQAAVERVEGLSGPCRWLLAADQLFAIDDQADAAVRCLVRSLDTEVAVLADRANREGLIVQEAACSMLGRRIISQRQRTISRRQQEARLA